MIKNYHKQIDWSQFEGMICTDMGDSNGNALDMELNLEDDREVADYLGTTVDELIK